MGLEGSRGRGEKCLALLPRLRQPSVPGALEPGKMGEDSASPVCLGAFQSLQPAGLLVLYFSSDWPSSCLHLWEAELPFESPAKVLKLQWKVITFHSKPFEVS